MPARNIRLTRDGDDWRQTVDEGNVSGLDVPVLSGERAARRHIGLTPAVDMSEKGGLRPGPESGAQ